MGRLEFLPFENTEVLVSRRSRYRISRPLIAVLGTTLAVGGTAYVHNVRKMRARPIMMT